MNESGFVFLSLYLAIIDYFSCLLPSQGKVFIKLFRFKIVTNLSENIDNS